MNYCGLYFDVFTANQVVIEVSLYLVALVFVFCLASQGLWKPVIVICMPKIHSAKQQCGEVWLGCNMGMGNSVVSQPWVQWVRVWFWNSGPVAVLQPITVVLWVFTVLSVHCRPKSRLVPNYSLISTIILTNFLITDVDMLRYKKVSTWKSCSSRVLKLCLCWPPSPTDSVHPQGNSKCHCCHCGARTWMMRPVSPHHHHLLPAVHTPKRTANTVDNNNNNNDIVVVSAAGVRCHDHCWLLYHPCQCLPSTLLPPWHYSGHCRQCIG